ncbi:DNA methyltransferase [Campylobacter jejuni]|uniref:DNA adenine methylase n=1 Tax=Campylobacter jejuni TaxID=197 RepID=UPI000F80080D|nr:DNA adenine methylase [Campylobacter jejuni]RTK02694.1 DNA methyltransferase [Campylobacter jejuni]HEF7701306.1 DNA adenine methylase [Campylobacter jejuni]HEF7706536.1 DNA adenine methylase [Campylobacter jejuni]HEF8756148.1 DNA adenine methylase [Campylobacter jejuni]
MHKYPKVNYIGNKEKISTWIIENLPIKKGKVLDLFSDGCAMSYAFKNAGFSVISNDILYSNYCISKAIIENSNQILNLNITANELTDFFTQKSYKNISWLSNHLYFDYEVKELACIINYSATLNEYEKFIFLALVRRAMIRKIPYSRMCIKWEEIVKFRDEELSYQKYGRRRAYHNISFLEHIYLNLKQYNNAVFDNGLKNFSHKLDCIKMLDKIAKVDLIYIDPPYPSTMNNYFNFYGPYDKIFKEETKQCTDFTNKNTFLQNLKLIFEKAIGKTTYIAMSLNNQSKPNPNEIITSVSNLTLNFFIYQKPHIYKVTGKENKKQNYEIVLIFKLIGS